MTAATGDTHEYSDLVKTRRTRRRLDDEQLDLRQRRLSLQRPDPTNSGQRFARACVRPGGARGGVSHGRAMALARRKADRAYLPGIGTLQRRISLPGKLGSSGNSGLECYSLVQVISFKNTIPLKRGVLL